MYQGQSGSRDLPNEPFLLYGINHDNIAALGLLVLVDLMPCSRTSYQHFIICSAQIPVSIYGPS